VASLDTKNSKVQKFQKSPKLDQVIRNAPKIALTSNFLADSKSS